jgi:CHASE3 domain sensor protein
MSPFRARLGQERFGCILPFQRKFAGVLAAAALLLFVAGLSYRRLVRNAEDRQWVVHTYQVIGHLDAMLQGMTDAETGERGYILSGENSYRWCKAARKTLSPR